MLKWLGNLVDSNEKELKRLQPLVEKVNALESEYEKINDTGIKEKSAGFKARFEEGESLDQLLPEAFALVREAAKRTLGQRHFDVQLMGGIVLHQGKIAEMKTGEGKTLVATLPLYLNSLSGLGCHLITVNDYLSKRDHQWMGAVFDALGITTGSIQHEASFVYDTDYRTDDGKWDYLKPVARAEAYQSDITYGTNNEFGFDYLRDNMVMDLKQCTQRPLNYAIVDEVDNILIDEARTPLIISGPAEEVGQAYQLFARLVTRLKLDVDFTIDDKHRTVSLTEEGIGTSERLLSREGILKAPNLYDPANYPLPRFLESSLKAHAIFQRDRNYVVNGGQVVIVDDFTGRLMPGRRYSEGLHQAIEAKERVRVQRESRTYATITFQNYFRMYDKLAGMTGTALTEAEEFHKIYSLEVVVMPTNKPMVREDLPDLIYKDEKTKFRAVVAEIERLYKEKRPVLIGTVSIDKSEILGDMLKRKGVKHEVLNANHHEKEAIIVAQAGRPGAVTVATNMAGRGVDIILGGQKEEREDTEWQREHDSVINNSGLSIIGTERHEARRIDNQLRGRAGRQGDPGSSRFFVSLEDDVVRRFGGDRIKGVIEWAGIGDDDTPIENKLINRSIESAQVKVEGFHFDIRKHLVDYDDVVNRQRELIYEERKKILSGADLKTNILSMIRDELKDIVKVHIVDEYDEGIDLANLINDARGILPLPPQFTADKLSDLKPKQIEEELFNQAEALYSQREEELGEEAIRTLERLILLRTIDSLWIEHLTMLEHLRQEAGWQTLRQVKAVDAYKKEGYQQFQVLMETIKHDVTRTILHAGIAKQDSKTSSPKLMQSTGNQVLSGRTSVQKSNSSKTGRNDPCPCGSGKKYKHCCGR